MPRLFALLFAVLLVAPSPLSFAQEEEEKPAETPVESNEPAEKTDKGADAGEKSADENKDGEKEEEEEKKSKINSSTFSALSFRSIGPALASGRVADFAVDPENRSNYFVAFASSGIWRTENSGTTWKSVFDSHGSYSIGCIVLDPSDSNIVWAGSGENNSQRSVSFGDGVYKSTDGGRSWKNVGLKESEHIGMIAVDPRDSNTVYVAAQGPLWRSGGDRGLYKTTDGGKNWEKILEIDEHTGANEIHLDPRDPDVLYCSTYQRRRRTWTLINGGPGSSVHKSTDAGVTWTKIARGLPGGDLGRIGLDVSPVNPDVLYAIVEAASSGGFYRSTNRGASWSKMSSTGTSSPQYYNEIVCDPRSLDTVYLLDTMLRVTKDGGRSFSNVPSTNRHVDNHALWLDPHDPTFMLCGNDGGVYDSHDGGKNWAFKANLPISQYYRVSVDTTKPFYYVYGGTQDNNSHGGPSRTTSRGIGNEDWFVTVGGDGYETLADPTDPNILYSLWQYGGLVRHDRRSGENVDIKPRERPGDAPYRWNWDSPIMISPHSPTRVYFAAQRLFRSDDRGESWEVVSEDLSRQIDRNTLEVMGKVWPETAVSKNRSTSYFGNIVSLSESPLVEGLLYVGTDDGLVQVSEDGGANWRSIESFPEIPEWAYVSRLEASRHDADRVYVAFSAMKDGDFKPYLMRSDDRGRSWTSIAGDLPDRNIIWSFQEDHVKETLLFAGCEFGCFVTLDGGAKWHKLAAGIPNIAVRDMDIHRGENDLVLGTFGRSFYVLDDYSPLRDISDERLETEDAFFFPVKDALSYVPRSRLGGRSGKGSQGASFYMAKNPPFGATFTWYLKDGLKTSKDARKKAEKDARKNDEVPAYPTVETIRAESREIAPQMFLTIRDDAGETVRRISASKGAGVHRKTWNLRHVSRTPVPASGDGGDGPMCLPGTYTVTLEKVVDGAVWGLTSPEPFRVVPLGMATLAATDQEAAFAFRQRVARLQRAVRGASSVLGDAESRVDRCRQAILLTPKADPNLLATAEAMMTRIEDLKLEMSGDSAAGRLQEPSGPSISSRISSIVGNQWQTSHAPTQTEKDQYRYAGEAFEPVLAELRRLVETDLPALVEKLAAAGAGHLPGQLPEWALED